MLAYFGKQLGPARRGYRAFVTKGIEQGRCWDLTGGGLIRSAGGWAAVKALKKEKVHVKSDERVLGDGDFVEKILSRSRERYERQYALKASGIDLDNVAARVAELLGMDISRSGNRVNSERFQARSLLCSGPCENWARA